MKKALIKLHVAVIFAGTTGLFGKLISLEEVPLVWYRLLLTTVILALVLVMTGHFTKVPAGHAARIGGSGMLLGLHWVLFYASIRASNVSIGVLCCSLIGFYTAVFEPMVTHCKFDWKNILFSAMTLIGLLLIFSFDPRYRLGIAIGAVSSLVAAFFSMTTKKLTGVYSYQSSTLLMYEMVGGLLFLTAVLPVFLGMNPETGISPNIKDFVLLLVLAGVCTLGQYLLQFDALKEVSAFTVNLTYNLEPVYSIIFAMILFGEARELNFSFYLGLILIVSSVLLQNYAIARKK